MAARDPLKVIAAPKKDAEEASSSRTQRLPQLLVEPSSLDVSIMYDADGDAADATQPQLRRPQHDDEPARGAIIVMQEESTGLDEAFTALGYTVTSTASGMETLNACTAAAPLGVVIGPGDVGRRRVLTGALRARFPQVLVVYVAAAADAASKEQAKRDGVRAVLPWPLPADPVVIAALTDASNIAPPTVVGPSPLVAVPMLSADSSETGDTDAAGAGGKLASPTSRRQTNTSPDDLKTLQVERLDMPATADSSSIGDAPVGEARVAPPPATPSREQLMQQVADLFWLLDDAARFLDDLATHHVRGADVHAATVRKASATLQKLRPQ